MCACIFNVNIYLLIAIECVSKMHICKAIIKLEVKYWISSPEYLSHDFIVRNFLKIKHFFTEYIYIYFFFSHIYYHIYHLKNL